MRFPQRSLPSSIIPLVAASTILTGGIIFAKDVEDQTIRHWEETASLLVAEANAGFIELAAREAEDSREVRFGEAITLLGVNPKTESNVERAAGILDSLARQETPDRFTIPALYYRARIEQIHAFEPDLASATDLYEAVRQRDPAHPLAELALVKLAIIRLAAEPDDAIVKQRAAEFQNQVAGLRYLPARRDLSLLLSRIDETRLNDKSSALDNLLEAQRSGITRDVTRASTLVRTAELARAVGRLDLARDSYQRFLKEFPRETRVRLVKDRLKELNAVPTI